MKTNEVSQEFDRYAEAYADKYMDVSAYRHSLKILVSLLQDKQDKILDLACGPANLSKYLLDKIPSLILRACDLAPTMLEIAKANLPNQEVFSFDALKLDELKPRHDVILCGGLLPYYSDDLKIKVLTDVIRNLKDNGYLYLTTLITSEEDSPQESKKDQLPTYLLSHPDSYELVRSIGFTIIYKELRTLHSDPQGLELIMIAQK